MTNRVILSVGAGAMLGALAAAPAAAQSLGSFSWQLQPFCNKVTVTVTQNGALYTLDGYDDQCGAAQRAPLVGLATPNPDGTIGFGLHIVTVPGGRSVHVDARISLASLGGSWSDSAGNSGAFVLNGNAAGSARPAPTVPGSVLAVGSIPGTAIANGAVGNAQIANGAVSSVQTSNEPGVSFAINNSAVVLVGSPTSVVTTSMRVPANGFVKIEVAGSWVNLPGLDTANCQLQKGAAAAIDDTQPRFYLRDRSADTAFDSFAAHRIVPVAVADNPGSTLLGQSFRLVCELGAGAISVNNANISATYYATSYAPLTLTLPFGPSPQQ